VSIGRGGEPYGATALPPPPRTPLRLVLAKLAPPLAALTAFFPWLLANCPACERKLGGIDAPVSFFTFWPQSHPWLLGESWALVVSALAVSWSLSLRDPIRTRVRRAGLAVGGVALAIPLAFGLGVASDPERFFVFTIAPGFVAAVAAYVTMAIASETA
jgi:hypothetical protein